MPIVARGRLALVTGASSGIGEMFATVLAERGLDLVITARSDDRLRELAADLTARHGVRVHVVPLDLAERGAPERLHAATESIGLRPDLLVNNAGTGSLGTFLETELERHLTLLRLNVETLVMLSRLYLPPMLERRAGGILNVSSTASFQPIPHFALYGASKAFVTSLTTALWAECRASGVRVTAVAPGPVADTRFGRRPVAGAAPGSGDEEVATFTWRELPRRRVVEAGLDGLERGEPIVVPGVTNAVGATAVRFVPRRPLMVVAERLLRGRAGRGSA